MFGIYEILGPTFAAFRPTQQKNKTQTQLSLLQTAELLQQGYRLATTVIPFEDLDPKMLYTRAHCLYLSIIEYMHNGKQAFLKQQNSIQQQYEKQVDVLKIFNIIPNCFMVDQASSLVVDYCLACPHLRRYLCTLTPWLTRLLVLGKSRVNQKSRNLS